MNVLIIIALAALLVLIGTVFFRRARKMRARKAQELHQKQAHAAKYEAALESMKRAERDEEYAQTWLGGDYNTFLYLHGTAEDRERRQKLQTAIGVKKEYEANRETLQRLYTDFLQAQTLAAQVERLRDFIWKVGHLSKTNTKRFAEELELDLESLKDQLGPLVIQRYEELCEEAPTSQVAFLRLQELIKWTKPQGSSPVPALEYPPEWIHWVARWIDNPDLHDFNLKWIFGLTRGSLRIRAASAIEDQSLTEAAMVLAYANEDNDARAELGDLAGQLARMVVRLRMAYQPS